MDKRGEPRITTTDRVVYSIGDETFADRLYNLSRTGCRIAVPEGRGSVGDEVEVTLLHGISAKGVVKWADNDALGIAFTSPVEDVAVRFFEVGKIAPDETCQPTDHFGRVLPPLDGKIR